MKVELQLARRDGSGPFEWKTIDMEWLPFQNEVIKIGPRAFQVIQRGFNFIEERVEPDPEAETRLEHQTKWTQECGMLLQQVAGPHVIEPPSLKDMTKLGLQS